MAALRDHWEAVYRERGPDRVSWHQENPALSVELIAATGADRDAPVVDVGGGSSRLVDRLVAAGYTAVTVLDLSAAALGYARRRLGAASGEVNWVEADVTRHRHETPVRVWHDRAVFHFLVDDEDRDRYLARLGEALSPDGDVIIATFGTDGPERCSGLPVRRYSPELLAGALGTGFFAVRFEEEDHLTPAGKVQQFLYGWFRRAGHGR